MGDMLDNRDFDGGGEDVGSEAVESEATTSEENTEAQASVSEEKNTTEENSEASTEGIKEEVKEEEIAEETSGESIDVPKEKPLSTRANRRFQKILDERNKLAQKVANNDSNINESNKLPLAPNEDGEIEMTPDQLTGFISQQVQTTLQAEREQQFVQERANAWDEDISELMDSTPELNPESKQFNKALSDSLVELIRVANTDDSGNPTVRKLPSEVYGSLQQTINAAKSDGKKEASANLAKSAEQTAIRDNTSASQNEEKYSDEELANLQHTDPRKYAELIEDNII